MLSVDMRHLRLVLFLLIVLFTACALQKGRKILLPDPEEVIVLRETWEIIETQNGPGQEDIPIWVNFYLEGSVRKIEALDSYNGKYVFIGENRGNFNALRQWAKGFTPAQDVPGLVARRVENRFTSATSLYPDDEYGEYFTGMMKKVSDGEYPGAVKEQTFWIKRKMIPNNAGETNNEEIPPPDAEIERYEYLILVTIEKGILQKQIYDMMATVKFSVSVTREQTAAFTKIQFAFFEDF
jgi:hypothetical protein